LYHHAKHPPHESEKTFYVEHENGKQYYVLNPFLVSLFRDRAIWFSPGSAFNDPWDAGNAVSILRSDRTLEAAIVQQIFTQDEHQGLRKLEGDARYETIECRIHGIFRSVRFACFSRRLDSPPMWAHYADNHQGVCMMFEFLKWNAGVGMYTFDNNFRAGYQVRYSREYAEIPEIENFGAALSALYTKSPEWNYEEEVRFMKFADPAHLETGGTVQFNRRSLTHLILGHKVPRLLWKPLRTILDTFEYSHVKLIIALFNQRTKTLTYKQLPMGSNTPS
jgi:hypothetical protein